MEQKLSEQTAHINQLNDSLKKAFTNISDWDFKYKCLLDKTYKIEKIEINLSESGMRLTSYFI